MEMRPPGKTRSSRVMITFAIQQRSRSSWFAKCHTSSERVSFILAIGLFPLWLQYRTSDSCERTWSATSAGRNCRKADQKVGQSELVPAICRTVTRPLISHLVRAQVLPGCSTLAWSRIALDDMPGR
jgi:hypothetical protein